jgi:hypothetical protein
MFPDVRKGSNCIRNCFRATATNKCLKPNNFKWSQDGLKAPRQRKVVGKKYFIIRHQVPELFIVSTAPPSAPLLSPANSRQSVEWHCLATSRAP